MLRPIIPWLFRMKPMRGWLNSAGVTNEPNIIIRRPHDSTSEKHWIWWHVEVENLPRPFPLAIKTAERCLVDLKFIPFISGHHIEERGRWATDTDEGEVETVDLRVGDRPQRIPIVLRSIIDVPQWRYAPIEAEKIYATGVTFLHHRVGLPILPVNEYAVQITVHSGVLVWRTEFHLMIPVEGLRGFVLEEASHG